MARDDEHFTKEDCLRSTLEHMPEARDLTRAEVDHAVAVGMKVIEGGDNHSWGDLARAGVASVRVRRERP